MTGDMSRGAPRENRSTGGKLERTGIYQAEGTDHKNKNVEIQRGVSKLGPGGGLNDENDLHIELKKKQHGRRKRMEATEKFFTVEGARKPKADG